MTKTYKRDNEETNSGKQIENQYEICLLSKSTRKYITKEKLLDLYFPF